jgi:hypothetical protein
MYFMPKGVATAAKIGAVHASSSNLSASSATLASVKP